MRVGFDAAALVLNRAGEYRYASALRQALREREDVELHELWPGSACRAPCRRGSRCRPPCRAPGTRSRSRGRRAARAFDVLHHPRYAVSPEPGLRVPVVVTMHDVLVLSAPELFSAPIRANFRALAGRSPAAPPSC